MKKSIETIFFDLGNVLFSVNHTDAWNETKKQTQLTTDELFKRFYSSGDMIEHMIGKIDDNVFFQRLLSLVEYQGSEKQLESIWQNVFHPIHDRLTIVQQLSEQYKLGIISNISPVHSTFLEQNIAEMNLFSNKLYSWETGFMKPRNEMFLEALKRSRMSPNKCLFIDDQQQHVEAAQNLGMNAIQIGLDENLSLKLNSALKRF